MKNKYAKIAATLAMLGALAACTMSHTPNPYLPDRSGITSGQTITVGSNENIYTVARKYNVSMRELIALNNLKPPFEIRAGQNLTLPAGGGSFGGTMPPPAPAPLIPVEKNNLSTIDHAPVSSESLAPLAPPATAPQPASPQPVSPQSVSPQSVSPQSMTAPPAATAQPVAAPPPQSPNVMPSNAAATATAATTTETAATPEMIWPVQGPIVSGFGAKGSGLANDGVNISAPKGSPVVAAAAGTVVYAGDEMKSFGNLVLIRHQGDWITAYAHLDRVLVKKDAVVAQGDEIGTVGKSGNVTSPQIHFEIRQGGKPVDPAGMIKNPS